MIIVGVMVGMDANVGCAVGCTAVDVLPNIARGVKARVAAEARMAGGCTVMEARAITGALEADVIGGPAVSVTCMRTSPSPCNFGESA